MTNIKDEEEDDELCLADLLYIKFPVSEAVFVHKEMFQPSQFTTYSPTVRI